MKTAEEIVASVERVVLELLPRRLTLRNLALRAGSTPAEINAAFHAHFGVPLYRRLLSLRLEEAERLLSSDPTMPVEIAAVRCGFGHYGVFQRNFRVRFGREPRFPAAACEAGDAADRG